MEPYARLPLGPGLERGPAVSLTLDGRPVTAYLGESVATMMLTEGHIATRVTRDGSPRGVFCAMGFCFDCLVVVDGVPNTRACVTWVRDGMQVARQDGLVAASP
jgi:D-hydroxyproline dehydrogenase subunit gamma